MNVGKILKRCEGKRRKEDGGGEEGRNENKMEEGRNENKQVK